MADDIYFRAFELNDLEFLNEIRNDEISFEHTGGNKFFISKEYDKKWIEDKIFNNQKQIYLAICLKNNQIIGYVGLTDIDYRNRKVKWAGINIHKDYIGKGYGSKAARLLIKFVFEELNMNKLYGYWLETNIASIKMAKKVGFIQEGLIKDFVFKRNRYHNAILLSLLKTEYIQKYYS